MILKFKKELSDEEVFIKTKDDPDFFGIIIDRYNNKLDRYIKKISGLSDDDREDILQDIFISAYQNINAFDENKKFSSWIYRIAHNKVIDNWRKYKNRQTDISVDENLSFIESIFNENSVENEIQDLENKELLTKLYLKLPIKYREVFVLRFQEGKAYNEISEILKIPVSSVGVLINRGKKELQKEYQKLLNTKKNEYEKS